MMDVYQVGPDDPDECPRSEYLWMVHHYTIGSWEGSGTAVALRPDGKLDIFYLGHCSCYGPFDRLDPDTVTVDEFLREPDSVHDPNYQSEIVNKVRELLRR
jgi:hypothetical protein